jgi:hypothetical protein
MIRMSKKNVVFLKACMAFFLNFTLKRPILIKQATLYFVRKFFFHIFQFGMMHGSVFYEILRCQVKIIEVELQKVLWNVLVKSHRFPDI